MTRPALWVLAIGLTTSTPAAFAQETQPAPKGEHRPDRLARDEARLQEEEARLIRWKWANFVVLAGAIVYVIAKNGGPFFAARSREIRKDMMEAGDVRKEAEERAAAVDRKLAGLAADIARLKAESEQEREAETERLRLYRESERAKIQARAEREIESAGKAARLDLKRYAALLAVNLAEQKIGARMSGEVQDRLVNGFVGDLAASSSPSGGRN